MVSWDFARIHARGLDAERGRTAERDLGEFLSRPRLIGWTAAAAGLIAAIALASVAAIINARERALELAKRELGNTSFVLAARIESTFENIERVQTALAERIQAAIRSNADFGQEFSGRDVHLMLQDKHLGLPHVGSFTLVDADGRLFNFSRFHPPPPDIDLSDRSFFRELRRDGAPRFVISEPVRNRATHSWVI
jgi:hypothetical protein